MTYPHQFALHVIDFYLFTARKHLLISQPWPQEAPGDFDLITDQREGW